MARARITVIAVLTVALMTGLGPGSATGASSTGVLRVTERFIESPTMYVEGAVEYVSVQRVSTGALVLKRRFDLGEIRLTRRLPAGRYLLTSWTRSCSGTCENLDPPTSSCKRVVRVRGGKTRRVTIVSQVGQHCRITL